MLSYQLRLPGEADRAPAFAAGARDLELALSLIQRRRTTGTAAAAEH